MFSFQSYSPFEKDIQTFQDHVKHVASSGVGLVINGSMGEAHHLSREERSQLVKAARTALDSAEPPLSDVPIIAGTGTGSTKETLVLCKDAAEAGADAVIVITSGYYAGAIDNQALRSYFMEIAAKSPLPVMIYNCPFLFIPSPISNEFDPQLEIFRPRSIGWPRHGLGAYRIASST